VLDDVMTDAQYNDSDNEEIEKKDDDKKKKSVAFKASTSSKSKGKAKKEASSEDEDASDIDDEAMALLVRKMGKFIKKRCYGARKRRDHVKEHVRLCYKCKGPDHIVADCPYNSDNEEDEKKKKKDKKEKKEKEKKMTFKKKKGSGYVVTWDSDFTEDSDDEKKSIKKALASIAIHNKPSLFDTPSTCLMAKPTKVKYDESDDECESDDCRSDDEEDYSKRSSSICVINLASCSTFTSTSSTNDGFTCDTSLMVENETLKKEVNELTCALGKAYDGEDRLLMCLGSPSTKRDWAILLRKARPLLLITRLVCEEQWSILY
jgi:hypothetical protein